MAVLQGNTLSWFAPPRLTFHRFVLCPLALFLSPSRAPRGWGSSRSHHSSRPTGWSWAVIFLMEGLSSSGSSGNHALSWGLEVVTGLPPLTCVHMRDSAMSFC